MMYLLGVTLKALLVNFAGVAAMTGIMYVYWNALKNR